VETFTVTRRWIEAFRTEKGGWTRSQLEAIGVEWPPIHGWKDRAEGRQISLEARALFESRLTRSQVKWGVQLPMNV
jgi:predicted oxidoreductase